LCPLNSDSLDQIIIDSILKDNLKVIEEKKEEIV
jgi:hypothetical protein